MGREARVKKERILKSTGVKVKSTAKEIRLWTPVGQFITKKEE